MDYYFNQPQQPYGYPLRPTSYELMPYRLPLRKASNAIGMGVILVQIIMLVAMLLLQWIFSGPTFAALDGPVSELIDQSVQLTAYVLGFLIPIIIIITWIKIPANVAFPIRGPKATIAIPSVFVCLGASVIGMLAYGAVVMFLGMFGLYPDMPDMPIPEGFAANVVYCISLTVAPAIFEEMLFRGVILQSLRRFGDGFALVVSSILFGMIHGNLVQGPNALIVGLVIGYFVLRTGSLVTGMLIHFVNNALSTVLSYVMEAMTDPQIEALNMTTLAAYAIVGSIALVFLLVKHSNMFQLAPSNYPLPAAKKYTTFFTTAPQILFIILSVFLTSLFIKQW